MADAPRVFLSYSHDSAEHADRVLSLADSLCDRGIDVIFDRYVHPAPAEGWPRWMERNLDAAQFVLMVCTATYRRRVMGEEEPGQGTGVRWEGTLIYNRIAYGEPGGIRFIPILLPGAEPTHIPDPVRGHNHYRLATFDPTDPGYEALYRHLTDQPATLRPGLGSIQNLPPKPRPQAVPGPLPSSGVVGAGTRPAAPASVPTVLDPQEVERAARALADYLGPLAYTLARKRARNVSSIRQLYEVLAEEISSEEQRKRFLGSMPR